jgi:hypothetical protein
MSKQGSTISGLMDSFAMAISYALHYGVPLQFLVGKFAYMPCEPSGFTNNQQTKRSSIISCSDSPRNSSTIVHDRKSCNRSACHLDLGRGVLQAARNLHVKPRAAALIGECYICWGREKMDAGCWEEAFSEARRRLLECGDCALLRDCGHELKDGAVLTSVSEVPFEMSLKCGRCGEAYWFENLAWTTGGAAQWQFNRESRERAHRRCRL